MRLRSRCLLLLVVTAASLAWAQTKRKVITDQDCRGPATTDLQALLVFIQSPDVELLGITVVSGDEWRDEEVAHTLRLLELIGRTDIPVVPGAVFPLINNKKEIAAWEKLYGRVPYKGAWNDKLPGPWGAWNHPYHAPFVVPALPEGNPTTKAMSEDAPHFLVRMVRKYPHEVTIYAGGPLTDLALALAIDPEFPSLVQELVVMGGSINPVPERRDTKLTASDFGAYSRREFNFWWDPEAAHMVLHAKWPKLTVTPVDISIKTRLEKAMIAEIAKADTPVARYLGRWSDEEYMWDELAAEAWLNPSIITNETTLAMDVDISHDGSYGNTLTWLPKDRPDLGEQLARVQVDLDQDKFYRLFKELMTRPTPKPSAGVVQSTPPGSGQ